MIRGCFLSKEDRGELIALARDGSAASRVTRRAKALVLLDEGWSCQQVAHALLLDDDKVPKNWGSFRHSVTDTFRVINPRDIRVVT